MVAWLYQQVISTCHGRGCGGSGSGGDMQQHCVRTVGLGYQCDPGMWESMNKR